MINIFNVREGFANNSSSSHSIIFKSAPIVLKDNYDSDLQFGWDTFTIGSKEGVLDYLKAILACNFDYEMNNDYVRCIIESWVGPINYKEMPSIDHQSIVSLPYTYKEDAINKEFFMELKELFLTQDTVILGGNDNDGEHPLTGLAGIEPTLITEQRGYIAKKDPVYDYWTFFNRMNGSKFRCVLNEKGLDKSITPVRASSPDLVDIKITDYCGFNCGFCYQGSTKDGQHAEFDKIRQIIDVLSDNEVLEIAFGGGEPTQHPGFMDILKYAKRKHIVPNFTTKNVKWLKENLPELVGIIGSCAVSVDSVRTLETIQTIKDFYDMGNSDMICAQVVMGTIDKDELQRIIKKACEYRIPLTLLGYKTNGRGQDYRWKKDYTGWLDWVKEVMATQRWYKIGIDTALVRQSEDAMKQAGIPTWLYHKEEGLFSWYIDAVAKTMGPSSYEATTPYPTIYSFAQQYKEYGDKFEASVKKPRQSKKKTV